ncbi:MAG: hypothetical protein ACTSR5_12390 [Promethearchaeota archaeon]
MSEVSINGKENHQVSKIRRINKWLNTKSISYCHCTILFGLFIVIYLIVIVITGADLNSIISFFFIPILCLCSAYRNTISDELSFSSPKINEIEVDKILLRVKQMIKLENLMLDLYELDFLNYIQLKKRRWGIKILRTLIYILLLLIIILFIIDPSLSWNSTYGEFKMLIVNTLSLMFMFYITLERIRKKAFYFKNWLITAQKQIRSIMSNSILKKEFAEVKSDFFDLEKRITNFASYFNPVKQISNIAAKISYFLSIFSLLIEPIMDLNLLLLYFEYYGSLLFLFVLFLLLYFYYSIYDKIKFQNDPILRIWKDSLDGILKLIHRIYSSGIKKTLDKIENNLN